MKKTLLKSALIALAGVGLMAGSANALEMGIDGIWDNITPVDVIQDNVAPDLNTLDGKISIINYEPSLLSGASNWLVDATGVNFLTLGDTSVTELDLLSLAVSSQDGGDIWIMLSEINLDDAGWNLHVGGTTDGTVEFFALIGDAGDYWTQPLSLLTSFSSGSLVGNPLDNKSFSADWNTGSLTGPYSLIIGAHIIHASSGNTSFDLAADPVPEPATMLLFGTGLAGLAGVARRRKK